MAEGGYIDVKCRVNGVLDKLKDCSEELHEIERIMRDARDGSSKERSDLLSTVREMLGALETGLKRAPEYEKSKGESSRSKRMRSRRSVDPGICTHTCVHHPEIVNPGLWSKLTEDLLRVVFARLPIPRIIELRESSKAWAAMSNSASFKGAFAEANPKVFGLLGWDSREKFCTKILDAASNEWHGFELDFPKDYVHMNYLYACDGGLVLVCFIPEWEKDECFECAFVCNPLTNAWRKLPDIPFGFPDIPFGLSEIILVQLVTSELFYRVILVFSGKLKSQDAQTFGAFVYDSRSGSWSVMSSGLVYGTRNSSLSDSDGPQVFDCATKRLFHLNCYAARQVIHLYDLNGLRSSFLKDLLFVLHAPINLDSRGNVIERFVISEFTWECSRSDLRKLNDYEVALMGPVGRHDVEIFTSTGFILVTWDNEDGNGSVRQLIRIYDVSAGRWRDLPPLIREPGIRNEKLGGLFMCELRWHADP